MRLIKSHLSIESSILCLKSITLVFLLFWLMMTSSLLLCESTQMLRLRWVTISKKHFQNMFDCFAVPNFVFSIFFRLAIETIPLCEQEKQLGILGARRGPELAATSALASIRCPGQASTCYYWSAGYEAWILIHHTDMIGYGYCYARNYKKNRVWIQQYKEVGKIGYGYGDPICHIKRHFYKFLAICCI